MEAAPLISTLQNIMNLSTITEADEEIRQKSLKRGWHPVVVHYRLMRKIDGRVCKRRYYAVRFFSRKGCAASFIELGLKTPAIAQNVAATLNAARAIGV